MKSIYLLIGVFFVWCLLASLWFLFWVKGLSPKPDNINPHESALAIAEILFMILISVLIGFALAWLLRQEVVNAKEHAIQRLVSESATHHDTTLNLQDQVQKAEATLERARETFREDFLTASRENERLKRELEETQNENKTSHEETRQLRIEFQALQLKLHQSERDYQQANTIRQTLEKQVTELQKEKLEKPPVVFSLAEKITGKAAAREKDDLKVIDGIGPAIEKKLNAQGIYSFRQVSEFTDESIKKITQAIKLFPGRIDRDRWVEQASKLYLDKIRK